MASHGSHRYWRLSFTAGGSGGIYALSEVELRATPGGADQTGAGTALASSSFNAGTNPPSNVFDNNTATWWATAQNQAVNWIGYDFGSAIGITEALLTARNDSSYVQAPTTVLLEYSDNGIDWFHAESFSGLSFPSAGSTQTITVVDNNPNLYETALSVEYAGTTPSDLYESGLSAEYAATNPSTLIYSGFVVEVAVSAAQKRTGKYFQIFRH